MANKVIPSLEDLTLAKAAGVQDAHAFPWLWIGPIACKTTPTVGIVCSCRRPPVSVAPPKADNIALVREKVIKTDLKLMVGQRVGLLVRPNAEVWIGQCLDCGKVYIAGPIHMPTLHAQADPE